MREKIKLTLIEEDNTYKVITPDNKEIDGVASVFYNNGAQEIETLENPNWYYLLPGIPIAECTVYLNYKSLYKEFATGPYSKITKKLIELDYYNDLQIIKSNDTNFILKLNIGDYCFLVKEKCLAKIVSKYVGNSIIGMLEFNKVINDKVQDKLEQWYVRPNGTGLDGKPLIYQTKYFSPV